MDHAALEGMLQTLSGLHDVSAGVCNRQRSLLLNEPVKRGSFHELHDQEMHIAFLIGVVGRHDVRMSEPGSRLHFLAEAFHDGGPIHQVLAQDLESDDPAHDPVLGLVHGAHAAGA